MKIAVVGIGYVGLVSAACFADLGVEVYCVDINEARINDLKQGIIPIYEPGLEELVRRGVEGKRLHFHTSIADVLDDVEVVFIAVGTPSDEDGSADLKHVLSVAKSIGQSLSKYCLVVTKSTVKKRNVDLPFDVASNPEFLKEGDAIDDFMKPDRVVVGVDSEDARELMTRLYKPMLLNNFRVIFMDIASAEITKYAANAMLATRISFMNEIAALCEAVGANVNLVRQGIGSDARIGSKFLYAGCGYGGSCYPKDVKALIHTGMEQGTEFSILKSVEEVNERQKRLLVKKFSKYYNGDLRGKKVAVWGLSFKPGTDDMREAPAIVTIKELLELGCEVAVYDPVAMLEAKRYLGDSVYYAQDIYDCSVDADAIFHITEWKEFRMPSWSALAKLVRQPLLIDGRNVFDSTPVEQGFTLLSIGF